MATSLPVPRSAPALRVTPSGPWAVLLGPLKIALVLLGGAALGLSATAVVLERKIDPGAVRIGPWVTWPKSGTVDIDPYAQAITARTGSVPLAAAVGLSFTAAVDDRGAGLSARCAYRIDGAVPAARFWTLTATTAAGLLMDNLAGRSAFSSAEILRRSDGSFSIAVAPNARPGNWLPVSGGGPFILTLRLYETPLSSVASGDVRKAKLPSVTPLGCAS